MRELMHCKEDNQPKKALKHKVKISTKLIIFVENKLAPK